LLNGEKVKIDKKIFSYPRYLRIKRRIGGKKMKKNRYVKASVAMIVLFVLLISSAQAMNTSVVKKTDNAAEGRGWYWKPSYPNYAPQGLPDFNQQQDRWKKISPGPNGVLDSTVAGDDVINVTGQYIAPGPDCYLNSTATGDDIEEWIFCGPVAVANCFWWFDSKYADPHGIPGDGDDQFSLVQDYGAGDDHTPANAPLLIENLARAMNTTEKGTTDINDMQNAIVDWFNTTGLTDKFTIQTYDQPEFSFIESEIERSQNVILLLGSYDYIHGPLTIDQSQINGAVPELCKVATWTDYQSFIPTAGSLDAIQILLQSVGTPCDVKINVYNAPSPAAPIGTMIMNPGALGVPTWVEFKFNSTIPLTAGSLYYFDVVQMLSGYHYEWYYDSGNPYPPGQGWMRGVPMDPYGLPFDWAFQTEYYNPPPHPVYREGHYVTCAGVNSGASMIAFSDPTLDVANPSPDDHNNAAYVSHDIYNVSIGSPKPDINCQWWLSDYQAGYNYTVVEQAVVICPVPDITPPTLEITRPIYALYFMNKQIIPLKGGTLIIGKIDVNVNATDDDSGIDRVEFYVNNQLLGNDSTAPYSWLWNETAWFKQTLRVVAFDKEGNSTPKEIEVWKFF
jgi:Bacterial Ig domain